MPSNGERAVGNESFRKLAKDSSVQDSMHNSVQSQLTNLATKSAQVSVISTIRVRNEGEAQSVEDEKTN